MTQLTVFDNGQLSAQRSPASLQLSKDVRKALEIRLSQMQGANLLAQVGLEELSHLHRKAGTELLTTAAFYELLKRVYPDGVSNDNGEILDQLWRLYQLHLYKITESGDTAISGSMPKG